jgi:hypothetical protein
MQDALEAVSYHVSPSQVSFQPVVPPPALQSLLPAGRPILTAKPFTQPIPAFGPNSIGYVPIPRNNDGEAEGDALPMEKKEATAPAKYAGSGSYF